MREEDLKTIVMLIWLHHHNNPDHGTDCACLDAWIQQVRDMTKVPDPGAQRRVDYVLRKATENRP